MSTKLSKEIRKKKIKIFFDWKRSNQAKSEVLRLTMIADLHSSCVLMKHTCCQPSGSRVDISSFQQTRRFWLGPGQAPGVFGGTTPDVVPPMSRNVADQRTGLKPSRTGRPDSFVRQENRSAKILRTAPFPPVICGIVSENPVRNKWINILHVRGIR